MSDNQDNSNSDSYEGLGSLLLIGIFGYAAYKALTSKSTSGSNDTPAKRRLSSYDIESIVSKCFYSIDGDEAMLSGLAYLLPDFMGIKNNHYDDMMLRRLNMINDSIKSMISSNYEAYNPQIGESQLKDLVSFIRKDCYHEVKDVKFISQLEGNLLSYMPGMKLIGKVKNANIDRKIITAISKGLSVYFSSLYVFGTSIDSAKEHLKDIYVSTFINSLD